MTCPRHRAVTDSTRVGALKALDYILSRSNLARLVATVRWGVDPCKELTEAHAITRAALAWAAAQRRERSDTSMRVLVVGDGREPRAGAMLAAQTAWRITSLDPLMRVTEIEGLPNLTCVAEALSDGGKWTGYDLVLAPHSHAPIDATRAAVRPGGAVVAMPCCIEWPEGPRQHSYHVDTVLSPERRIVVERRARNEVTP